MEAYRDQYATLFNKGKDVVVIAVSAQADTTLASWAREGSFPVLFGSDLGGTVGKAYGAFNAKVQLDDRSLFVIGPDGKISYKAQPFRELVAESYTALQAAVEHAGHP